MINILADDNSIIPYRKELNKITGCVTASILLSQILYWWKKSGGEFYKFKEPCKHEKYTEGDSWCEELGYSRNQFDNAFKKLEKAGFVSKRTSIDRVTYYNVNEVDLRKSLNSLYENTETHFTNSEKVSLVYKEAETTQKTTTDNNNNIGLIAKAQGVFDYWNTKEIIIHRSMTDSIKSKIISKLREYSNEDILDAIRNYSDVYHSDKTFFSHKWTLEEFLKRDNGMKVFLYKRVEDYLIKKSNHTETQTSSNRIPAEEGKYQW